MSTADNKRTVEAYFAAVNAMDEGKIRSLLADDFAIVSMNRNPPVLRYKWGADQFVAAPRLMSARMKKPLELRLLNRSGGMQGLSSLSQLARQEQALIAINGGYFNRVNRLPLGALRDGGIWLAGPILNRGAAGWKDGELPRFDRLMLAETIEDSQRQRWSITTVNSGYVQKDEADSKHI